MRSMRRTRRKIDHEGLLRCDRFRVLHPLDSSIGHIRHEVITLLWRLQRLHGFGIFENDGVILVCLACDQSAETVEAPSCWPAIKWADDTALPIRRIVIFSEPCCVISVVLENRAHRGGVALDHAVIARVSRCPLGQKTRASLVVILPRNEGCPRRCANGSGMKACVPQALRSQFVQFWRLHGTAEGAGLPEANVVE